MLMDVQQKAGPFINVRPDNIEQRLRDIGVPADVHELPRLRKALQELYAAKEEMVVCHARDERIPFRVAQGLGATCITCVENHVTPILCRNGLRTEMFARQFPHEFWGPSVRAPQIHAYNTVIVGGRRLVVDMDFDPFMGVNSGIVVVPTEARIPVYDDGFVYHSRELDERGRIVAFTFAFEDTSGQAHVYAQGSSARYITMAPYHLESGENRCPISLAHCATIYFAHERSYQGGACRDAILFTLVCPKSSGDMENGYQIDVGGVKTFRVHEVLHPAFRDERQGISVQVRLSSQRLLELLIAADGTLRESNCVAFRSAKERLQGMFRARIRASDQDDDILLLPRPSISDIG